MTLKRIFCALLCLLLIVGAPVMAEEDKDARIAERTGGRVLTVANGGIR